MLEARVCGLDGYLEHMVMDKMHARARSRSP